MILFKKGITKALIRLREYACWSAPLLFANPRRQVFSRRVPINNVRSSIHCYWDKGLDCVYFTIFDLNEGEIRMYLPDINIHKGRKAEANITYHTPRVTKSFALKIIS